MKSENWTNQCQGVASDGRYWIFSGNSSNRAKALFSFAMTEDLRPLSDSSKVDTFTFGEGPFKPVILDRLWIDHVGQLTFFEGELYVSHFNNDGAQAIVFSLLDGRFKYVRTIYLDKVAGGRAELQAINPWDRKLYTSYGEGEIDRFFIHNLDGTWTKEWLPLNPPLKAQHFHRLPDKFGHYPVQGACFSPNGHLYVSSNNHPDGDESHQVIRYYSALTGRELGLIPVLAKGRRQELEGICWARGAIYAVLLDIYPVSESDDVFFKRFTTELPELI